MYRDRDILSMLIMYVLSARPTISHSKLYSHTSAYFWSFNYNYLTITITTWHSIYCQIEMLEAKINASTLNGPLEHKLCLLMLIVTIQWPDLKFHKW